MEASCQCGQLQAHVANEARSFTILCHCSACQRRSGSPFGVIGYFPKNAVGIEGDAREFSRENDLGNIVTNGFCPACGSTIYVVLSKNTDLIGVPVGAFADPGFPRPDLAVWEQNRHDWVSLPEAVQCYQRGTDQK